MKRTLLTISIILFIATNLLAYDFSAVCSTGQTLYYNITSNGSVSVTYPYKKGSGYEYYSGYTKPIGNVKIPNVVTYNGTIYSVTSIKEHAFFGCSSLTSITIPNTITSIDNYAFNGCTSLKEVTFEDGSETLTLGYGNDYDYYSSGATYHWHRGLFYDCPLEKIYLGRTILYPESDLEMYGYSPFYGKESLYEITISGSVTSIGSYAFKGCSGLTKVNAESIEGWLGISFSNYDSNPLYYAQHLYVDEKEVTELIVPEAITQINNYAFYNCSGLTLVTIGNSVTSIGSSAFSGCNNIGVLTYNTNAIGTNFSHKEKLATVNIGNEVTSICASAFYDCSGITSVTIPNSVTSIGSSVFNGCSGLTSITIPNSVTSIDNYVFNGCTSLKELIFEDGSETLTLGYSDYVPYGYGHNGKGLFYDCPLEKVYLGRNLRYETSSFCGYSPFSGIKSLTELIIGNSVTSIGENAFSNCTQLTDTLLIPQSVTSIGISAFQNCEWLLSLRIANANTTIGDNAFAGNSRLLDADLGNGTKSIGKNAFNNCYRLRWVKSSGGLDSIGYGAFVGCQRLSEFNLPQSLKTIGGSAFAGVTTLTGTLSIPNNVTTIGESAYSGCTGLQHIVLGSSVASIEGGAFSGCTNIEDITVEKNIPPTIYSSTFNNIDLFTPVYVPCGTINRYYVTNYWENFINLLESSPFNISLSTNDEGMGSVYVTQSPTCSNHNAKIYAKANEGYHFLKWNDDIESNPRQLSMNKDTSFVATFVPNNSRVEVLVNDVLAGKVSGGGLYGYMQPVVLNAVANSNYHFLKWSDGSTDNPRYLYAVQDTSFTAEFVSNVSTITVMNANPEMGTVSGGGIFYYQNQITISATPAYGYHFDHWEDGDLSNPRTIKVNANETYKAYFAVNDYAISASSVNTTMGSVSGGGKYNYNTQMLISATAAYGYHFVQWNDANNNNPRTITVTQDSAFTAQFAANRYTINVQPNDATMGSAYGSGMYNYNSSITISATATYGYHFTQWSDGNTDNPRIVTVSKEANYIAEFAIDYFRLTVESSNPAIGTASGGGSYNYNTPTQLTATANTGYHFTQWSDGNTDNPRTVVVVQNATYTAQFAINNNAISVNSSNLEYGTTSGSNSYTYNSKATISAIPYYGYVFRQWSDGNTDNPREVIVVKDATYVAEFAIDCFSLSVSSSNPTAGYTTGSGNYDYKSQIAIEAIPNTGYHFAQWSDGNSDNPRYVSVNDDLSFSAQFAINSYFINVSSSNSAKGVVDGAGSYLYNTYATISATPNYGYSFIQWNDGNTDNPRTFTVTKESNYVAQFDYTQFKVSANSSNVQVGSVQGSGSYNYASQLAITAQSIPHYHFVQWNDGITDNPRTILLTQDTSFYAEFAIDKHKIDVEANDNSMGYVSGGGLFDYSTTTQIRATPNKGYHFVKWSDGIADEIRRVAAMNDTVFTAIFEANTYNLELMSNNDVMGTVSGNGQFLFGSIIEITAQPKYGYHFVDWSDGDSEISRQVTLLSDTSIVARFAINQYDIKINCNDSLLGTVSGSGTYDYLSQVTISANAAQNCYFSHWSDGSTSNPRIVSIIDNVTYQAFFAQYPKFFIHTVSTDQMMGTALGDGVFYSGSSTAISATANHGYHFVRWSDGITDNPRVINVVEEKVYTAYFEPDMFEISVLSNSEAMGMVEGSGEYGYGEQVTLSAIPNNGYLFKSWDNGSHENPITITVSENISLIAIFDKDNENKLPDAISFVGTNGKVYSKRQSIVVENVDAPIYVFDVMGRLVTRTDAINRVSTEIPMQNAGIYIVKCGTVVKRVAVQ
ncbi:MAG: leucine-rich repeat protein [Salinivirgaceae bacterium]|nr:leucine-rich repeat protein [Salinivirgaceae bacterium]